MRRKVLARSVRSVVEKLEGRTLLSATLAANAGTATIAGTVYNDVDGNGIHDTAEPVVAGATVMLRQIGVDYPNNVLPTVQADVNGAFSFTTLASAEYTLTIVPDVGFVQDGLQPFIVSLSPNLTANVQLGETTATNNGGSGFGTISGTVYNDVNQDGIHAPTEDFLGGDTVYLDLNGSGVQTPNDPAVITDQTGQYLFDQVAAGSYLVRVVPRPGFHQDPPGYSQITLYSDQAISLDIGENNRSTISGVVFQDLNGDGIQEPGELTFAGETVFLDINLDGFPEPGMQNASTGLWDPDPNTGETEPYAVADSSGHYEFTGLLPGSYRVIIESASGFVQETPGYVDVTLAPAQDLILNLPEATASSVSGTVFDDSNGNGLLDPGEAVLGDQTVFLDINGNGVLDTAGLGADGRPLDGSEPFTTTDDQGNFAITDLGPGTYTMRLVTPAGGVITGPPTATHDYTFTLGDNSALTGENFGYQTPDLTISIVSYPKKPTFTEVQKHAIVRVTNVGSLPVDGLVGVTLWAQTTNTTVIDTDTAYLVGALRGRNTHLDVGQSRLFTVKFAYPTQMLLNSYYITAQVVSTVDDNNVVNDFSAPLGPVQIGPPTIDLGITYATPPAAIVDPGQPTSIALTITNTGNVTNKGTVAFRFYLSQGPQIEPTDVLIQTLLLKNIHVKPGGSKLVVLTLPFPQQTLGVEFINVDLDSGDKHGEANLKNNVAIAPSGTRFD